MRLYCIYVNPVTGKGDRNGQAGGEPNRQPETRSDLEQEGGGAC